MTLCSLLPPPADGIQPVRVVSGWRDAAYDRKLTEPESILASNPTALAVASNTFLTTALDSSTKLIDRLGDVDAEVSKTVGRWLLCLVHQVEDQPAPGMAGLFRLIEEIRAADTAGSDLTGLLVQVERSVVQTDAAISAMTSLVPVKARASFKSAYRQFRTEMADALLDHRSASPVALDEVDPSSGAALFISREGGSVSASSDRFDLDVVAKNLLRVIIRSDASLRWVANEWVSLCVHAEASTTPAVIAAVIADRLGMPVSEVNDQLSRIRGILLSSARRGL